LSQLSKKNEKFSNKKNKNFYSLPIKYEEQESESEGLLKLKLYFITVGQNPNKSNFSKTAIDEAENSLSNKPILAYIKNKDTDSEDFTAHEIEYKQDEDGNFEIVYLEQPIGTIPESNNFHYEELNGLTYGVCDAYVWEDYCSNAGNILKENGVQNLSMEILIEESVSNDGITDITKFSYSGITMLSNKIPTGIEGAHADVINFALDIKEEFFNRVKDLNESLKIKFSKVENEINNNDNKEETVMPKNKKEIAELFSLTAEQLEDELYRLLALQTFKATDWWGDVCERCKYCLIDYDDNFAYCSDREQGIFVKIPFSKQNDDISFDFEKTSRIKFSPIDWEGSTPTDEDLPDDVIDVFAKSEEELKEVYIAKFEKIIEEKVKEAVKSKELEFGKTPEIETIKSDYEAKILEKENLIAEKETSINDLTEKFNKANEDLTSVNTELETLKAYKLDKENKEKEELFAEYASELSEEEIKPIKDQIAEFSLDKIDTELKLAFANKNHKPSKTLPKYNNMGIEKFNWNDDKDSESKSDGNVWDRLKKKNKNN
jgi:hypothetical protein